MYSRLLSVIADFVELCVPMLQLRTKHPPWLSKPPQSLTARRSELWGEYKRARTSHGRSSPEASSLLREFQSANHEYRSFNFVKQSQCEWGLVMHRSDNPKMFHSYIRSQKVGRPKVGPLKLVSSEVTCNGRTMAECLQTLLHQFIRLKLYQTKLPTRF